MTHARIMSSSPILPPPLLWVSGPLPLCLLCAFFMPFSLLPPSWGHWVSWLGELLFWPPQVAPDRAEAEVEAAVGAGGCRIVLSSNQHIAFRTITL